MTEAYLKITNSIYIHEDELKFKFIRASGPGGQNVNKVETAVQLRFDAAQCEAIKETVFGRLRALAGSRMTKTGEIILTADQYRSQDRNRQDAVERLIDLIRQATIVPKKRKPTKPSKSARAKRMDSKKRRGDLKKSRSNVRRYD